MAQKPTYEELDRRVRELEKDIVRYKKVEEELQVLEEKYRLPL